MSTRKNTAGVLGAVLGVAAAGVAAGVAAERMLVRRSRTIEADPFAGEAFEQLPYDEQLTLVSDDDDDIHVEIVEPKDGPAELTVVFVHGFCLDSGTFHFQRQAVARLRHPRCRVVAYDQPGHGRSGRLDAGDYTLDALGATLRRVLDTVAPDGPVVLVGHSMGGMAIMALAEQHPEIIEDRVVGVTFISTSAGDLSSVTFGLPDMLAAIRRPLVPVITTASKLTPRAIDRARQASTDLSWLLVRRYGFGTSQPSPTLVSYVDRMIGRTSVEIIAGYLRTLIAHDRSDALAALAGCEVLVVAGDRDLFTPPDHSVAIAQALPHAKFVRIADGGHLALLESHQQVDEELCLLVARAARRINAGVTDVLDPVPPGVPDGRRPPGSTGARDGRRPPRDGRRTARRDR